MTCRFGVSSWLSLWVWKRPEQVISNFIFFMIWIWFGYDSHICFFLMFFLWFGSRIWFVYDFAMIRTISARPALQNMVKIINLYWFGAKLFKLLYKIQKTQGNFPFWWTKPFKMLKKIKENHWFPLGFPSKTMLKPLFFLQQHWKSKRNHKKNINES